MLSPLIKKLCLAAGVLAIGLGSAQAQTEVIPKELYTGQGIPDSLKEDANSVVRYSYDEMNIKSSGKITVLHHSLVTILNEKGDKAAIFELFYNRKYDTYSSIEYKVYDADGKLIKKYHKSDMYDGSAVDDETIVTDERFLGLKHTVSAYPTTVEESYEEDISSFLNPDTWRIQARWEQSVQTSICKVKVDLNSGFRYRAENTNIKPEETSGTDQKVYVWTAKNLKAIKKEDNSMPWAVMPNVKFALNDFYSYGTQGKMDSWENFGKWSQGLIAPASNLSPQRIAEIKQMTDTIKTEKGKMKFLYQYMQKNMRYVSIQLGIGGYKPFNADFVDQKKYGDCKALSNYMRSLLAAVGINAYYTIINAGANEEPADISFPHNDFNHVILCVPLKNDTTWLECTSKTAPFGVLSEFTENRRGLMITENGGKLVNTPKSTAQANQFNSKVHLVLNADGSAKAQVNISGTGGYRDMFVEEIPSLKLDEQKEYLLRYLNIKQPTDFEYKPGDDTGDTKQVDLNLEFDKFCDVMAGDRQFYKPSVFSLMAFTAPITEKRHADFYFDHPMIKNCVTTIELPEGFAAESVPANLSLKFTYGSYDVTYAYDATKNQVVSNAKFVLNNQVIPAAKYNELQVYLDNILKAQNRKLVIKRKA